jgi:hypothetical protein
MRHHFIPAAPSLVAKPTRQSVRVPCPASAPRPARTRAPSTGAGRSPPARPPAPRRRPRAALPGPPRLRQARHELLADHHPRAPSASAAAVVPHFSRCSSPLPISRRGPARRPAARDGTAERRCDEEREPLDRGGASERKQTRGRQRNATTPPAWKRTREHHYPVTADPRDREAALSQCWCGIAVGSGRPRLP